MFFYYATSVANNKLRTFRFLTTSKGHFATQPTAKFALNFERIYYLIHAYTHTNTLTHPKRH